ncbi:MAG: UbiA family prenyltransferase [Terracidiphilus sp.]|nr:UbiA family prenyltransferase [Terracidiphilus sp.]
MRSSLPIPVAPAEAVDVNLRPICVDLDGTLVKSDTLVDSLLLLARSRPRLLLNLPAQLLHGKAAFKAFVTGSVSLDVAHLPYNRALLLFLQNERAKGRPIYLATGADQRLAQRVATHLGLFSGVLGSDGATNLTGRNKLDRLRAQLGTGHFDYIGNDTPDLPLLACATEPMIANPSLRLSLRLRLRRMKPVRTFLERRSLFAALLKALRPHQWAKNLLVFFPLLLSHSLTPPKLFAALAAFFCFSLTASSAYIVNDLLDIDADRRHPRKQFRPFAAGDLGAFAGALLTIFILASALTGAHALTAEFFGWLLVYLATTLAYSFLLKRIALVDVLALSVLYILRLIAGGAATGTPISHWLAGFSLFLFLSLAIVKRFAELQNLRASNATPKNGRGYLIVDIDQLRSFGTASAYAAVVVFAIYISSLDVTHLYHRPRLLWLMVPLMLLWLNRVWLLASRGQLDEDPVAFALTDRMSLLMGVAVLVIAVIAL